MGIAERIYEVVKVLPETTAAEVLCFAEAKRSTNEEQIVASRRSTALPLLDKHAGRFKANQFNRVDLHDREKI